ncbi:MAG: hypothetical protein H6553_03900 [Chitinophagales bacterium]|nr:hypothetical protein [Chitinophagales bacterium]
MKNSIILFLVLIITSCVKDKNYTDIYKFRNESTTLVTVALFNNGILNDSFSLQNGRDTVLEEVSSIGGGIPRFIDESDSIIIVFNDMKKVVFYKDILNNRNIFFSSANIYDIEVQSNNKKDKTTIYTYTFTEADYAAADSIP